MELKVTGEYLTWAIRTSGNPHGLVEGMKTTLDKSQVDAIVAGRARIEGDNNNGYEYVEDADDSQAGGAA